MKTWHETMMISSDSFRECHENRGNTEPAPVVVVDDYISITNQGGGQYWSMYDTENGIELEKTYRVIINDEEQVIRCDMGSTHPELQGDGLNIAYNQSMQRYLITYYPSEHDIGSNPTVNFKIEEVEVEEPAYNTIKFNDNCDAVIINGVSYPCQANINLDSVYLNNLGDAINIFTAEFLHNAVYMDGTTMCKCVTYVPHTTMFIVNGGVLSYLQFNK